MQLHGREFMDNKIMIKVCKWSNNCYGEWEDSKIYDEVLVSITFNDYYIHI